MHAELASAGAEQISADADVVAQVEELPQLKALFANSVLLDVELEPLSILLEEREPGLAHQADRHDASGDAHVDPCGLEFLARLAAVFGQNLRNGVAEVVLARICRLPESFNLLQLLAPDFVDVFVERHAKSLRVSESAIINNDEVESGRRRLAHRSRTAYFGNALNIAADSALPMLAIGHPR